MAIRKITHLQIKISRVRIGTIINYECSGFTDKGVPRFGRYVRIRNDVIIQEHNESPESKDKLNF